MFAMTTYSLAVLVHVTAATLLIGRSMAERPIHRAIVAAPTLPLLRAWLEFGRRSAQANPVIAFAVLGTGLYLGSLGWWTESWFQVAAAAWVANSLLAARIIAPAARALGAAASGGDGPVPPSLDAARRGAAWPLAAAVMRANDLAMLYVMLAKPLFAESVATVSIAMALSLAVELAARRHHAPRLRASRSSGLAARVGLGASRSSDSGLTALVGRVFRPASATRRN